MIWEVGTLAVVSLGFARERMLERRSIAAQPAACEVRMLGFWGPGVRVTFRGKMWSA